MTSNFTLTCALCTGEAYKNVGSDRVTCAEVTATTAYPKLRLMNNVWMFDLETIKTDYSNAIEKRIFICPLCLTAIRNGKLLQRLRGINGE